MIGIICAMEVELKKLREAMIITEFTEYAGMRFYVGRLASQRVVLVRSGIGKVNAAVCVQILCDRFGVKQVWNTGIAGSLDKSIDIGDIVISEDAQQHDMDARAFGYKRGIIPQAACSIFQADERLIALACKVCERELPRIRAHVGRVLSGDQFIADGEKKADLKTTFMGMCTEMEGAAIAQAAQLNGVPFLIIRSISDKADDSASMNYEEFEQMAIDNMVVLTKGLLRAL